MVNFLCGLSLKNILISKENMKKGFTLSEIMIALVVIGVITSILLPVAFNNVPNENVMKFKKGNATLAKVINELVTSGEYYTPGDLGVKADGALINNKNTNDKQYFCRTFGNLVNLKSISCPEYTGIQKTTVGGIYLGYDELNDGKKDVDKFCKKYQNDGHKEKILTTDNISYYTPSTLLMGMTMTDWYGATSDYCKNNPQVCVENNRYFKGGNPDDFGSDRIYAVFCMDIDGLNQGEDPFGYGIRVDGKILTGKRADEWLEKSIQDKE